MKSPCLQTYRNLVDTPRSQAGGQITGGIRLGHVHLKVRDLNASLPFYTDWLGLNVTKRIGRFAFLAIAGEHHSLALEEVGARAENPSRFALGPTHFALEVSHEAIFFALRGRTQDVGLPFTSQYTGISWSFGVRDPDGNDIEIYVDRRQTRTEASARKQHKGSGIDY